MRRTLVVLAFAMCASAQPQQQKQAPRPRPPAPVVSPDVEPDGHVTFRLRAPEAKEVTLRGEWVVDGGIDVSPPVAMTRDDAGVWSVRVGPLPREVLSYYFTIDGVGVADPENPLVKFGAHEAAQSLVIIRGDPSRLHDIRDVPHGAVQENWYHSKTVGGDARRFFVYTPPDYDAKRRDGYPVLVLLHGSGNSESNWEAIGRANFIVDNLLAEKRAQPMLLVMPFGHAVPFGGPDQARNNVLFEQDLLQDIMPAVVARYNTAPGNKNRAVAGLSMGGMQALAIGLHHPEEFAWIGVFSPVTEPDIPQRYAAQLDQAALLNKNLSLLWIGCGTLDNLFKRTQAVDEALTQHGIHHEFHPAEGGKHSWILWRQNLEELAQRIFH
ncbi:MAG TPA: alpha/beta hydrolase-fold protein [Bryobacteraceae bacterium]|nr:alpha/beta hydrolase-fold protein [Bryobacteraceae bacterium]